MSFRLIQLISLTFIIFIIILNIKYLIFGDSIFKLASTTSIKYSVYAITFLNDVLKYQDEENNISIFYVNNSEFTYLHFFDEDEITCFLELLSPGKTYVVTFYLIYSWLSYEIGEPSLNLGSPILITNESNPKIISDWLKKQVNTACINYDLQIPVKDKNSQDEIFKELLNNGQAIISNNELDPSIIVKFKEIYI